MKKLIIGISVAATLFIANANAENKNGQVIFEAKGCALCHKKDMDTVGPSLKTIAIGYAGKESTLVTYLQGKGTAIVDPSRAAVMNPQLVKIKTLFDQDLKAVAEYIISANDRSN